MPISVTMYFVFVILLFTALLDSCCFGVVASRDQHCYTSMYDKSSCPESWHYWGNSCYRITEAKVTWFQARDECRSLGGVLAVPSSDQENDVIVKLIPENNIVWIDCDDLNVEGTWECREGNVEIAYRNWGPIEPNDWNDEDCAVLSTKEWSNKRQWYDVSCSSLGRAFCKMAGRPVLHM